MKNGPEHVLGQDKQFQTFTEKSEPPCNFLELLEFNVLVQRF